MRLKARNSSCLQSQPQKRDTQNQRDFDITVKEGGDPFGTKQEQKAAAVVNLNNNTQDPLSFYFT